MILLQKRSEYSGGCHEYGKWQPSNCGVKTNLINFLCVNCDVTITKALNDDKTTMLSIQTDSFRMLVGTRRGRVFRHTSISPFALYVGKKSSNCSKNKQNIS